MAHFTGVLTGFLILAVAAVGQAQTVGTAADGARREISGQLGASINNAGLQNTIGISWTWPLSSSDHPLLRDAHIATGIANALTPAQARVGGWVEVSPLSILDIRAGVDPSAYFGTFNALQSFERYDEPFDKDDRDARGGAKAGRGARTYVAPTLKLKAGPVLAAATSEFEWWRSNAKGVMFYEPTRDTLLKSDGDRLVTSTSVLMYQTQMRSGTLSAGLIYNFMNVFDAPENRIRKLGVIGVREFAGRRLHLPNARLTMVVAKYLEDPSKEGQWTAAMAVGFRTR